MWIPIDILFETSIRQKAAGGSGKTKAQKVPAQVAHCILRVKDKGKSVRDAWNICRASMTKYGYMKPPYDEKGKVDDLHSTVKGVRRGMRHAMEKGAPAKFKRFSHLLRKIEPSI